MEVVAGLEAFCLPLFVDVGELSGARLPWATNDDVGVT